MCKNSCAKLVGLLISIILGIVIGYLAFFGVIANIVTLIWIAFGIGVVGLLLAILLSLGCGKYCFSKAICCNGAVLVVGSLGTIVMAIIAFATPLLIFNVGIAIAIGLLGFFLIITILSLLVLALDLVFSNCRCRE